MKRFKFLELALGIGLALSLVIGAYASNTQAALAEKLIRLHVIANSDSAEDQALKLCVRDRVLEFAEGIGASDPQQAREKIRESLPSLERIAQSQVYACGYDYPVKVKLCNMYFDTREYDTFSLPAGYYDACRVEIGNASGQNWWCVMFPPLCISAAEAEFDEAADMAGLNDHERELIASGETVYRASFKAIEWFSKIKHIFKNMCLKYLQTGNIIYMNNNFKVRSV